jgi:hypothetical protein
MRIQYASELHLEFPNNSRFLRNNPIIPVGDILLLAGDIGLLDDDTYSLHPFWGWVAAHFIQTLVIPGNHEFYKSGDVGTMKNGCIVEIRPNVKCYYNAVVKKLEKFKTGDFLTIYCLPHTAYHLPHIFFTPCSNDKKACL